MKALCILFGLYVCLSSGEQWNQYPDIYTTFENNYNVNNYVGQYKNPYNDVKLNRGEYSPFFLPPHLRPKSYGTISHGQAAAEPTYPSVNKNGNQIVDARLHQTKGGTNLFSNPVDKTYAGNEVLRNNGVQNNLSFSTRRSFDGTAVNQGVNKVNRFIYLLNKTSNNPLGQSSYTSTLSTDLPNPVSILGSHHGGRYWVNENNENTKEGYWIQPRPLWNKQVPVESIDVKNVHPYPIFPGSNNLNPYPIFPDNNNVNPYTIFPDNHNVNPYPITPDDNNINPYPIIPDNNNVNPYPITPDDNVNPYPIIPDDNNVNPYPTDQDWNHSDQNQIECYNLADVIKDLRILVRKHNISEEKHSLKMLFRILQVFILSNNIENLPFKLIVAEIGKVLLNRYDDHNNLREDEIVQVLQDFKEHQLNNFLYEIRSHRETNLRVAVAKLALLLYRLKQTLILKGFSQESIRLVINRVVQWSVPLVGYYFEKECKVKTQRYILQNLEVALNVNLESVKHVGSVEELESQSNFGNLGIGSQGDLEGVNNFGSQSALDVKGKSKSLGGSENQGSTVSSGGLGNDLEGRVNLGGLENQVSGGAGSLPGLINQGIPGGLEDLDGQGNLGVLFNPGNVIGLGNVGNLAGIGGLGNR